MEMRRGYRIALRKAGSRGSSLGETEGMATLQGTSVGKTRMQSQEMIDEKRGPGGMAKFVNEACRKLIAVVCGRMYLVMRAAASIMTRQPVNLNLGTSDGGCPPLGRS